MQYDPSNVFPAGVSGFGIKKLPADDEVPLVTGSEH